MLGLAVPAGQQVDQDVVGQVLDGVLGGVGKHGVGQAVVVDHEVAGERDTTGRRKDAAHPVAEQVLVKAHRHDRIGEHGVGALQVVLTGRLHMQQQQHRGGRRAVVGDFVARPYPHL
jgi:hypothetical protein